MRDKEKCQQKIKIKIKVQKALVSHKDFFFLLVHLDCRCAGGPVPSRFFVGWINPAKPNILNNVCKLGAPSSS